jgi:histidine ammonia-lyase
LITIELDGTRLSCAQIVELAHGAPFAVSGAARERVTASAEYAARVAAERPLYGRSTGVGANRTVAVADPDAAALGLLRSHATSAGPLRSPERVRGMLAVRLNQLAAGGSGASPAVLDALAAALAADELPPVRELGSIGTGDLPALATTALTLAGELDPVAARPVRFTAGDALAFLSSNAGAIADAALAGTALSRLARSALPVAALSFAAVAGNPEAFAPPVEAATPFPGAREVCAAMRDLVRGSGPPARIQDPFALRALPQAHGALLDRLRELDGVVEAMANAPSENPLLLPQVGVAHHAAFHAAYLAQALDAARAALARAAQLVLARVSMLTEPAITGLPAFLGDGTPGASGVMMVEYVAGSALALLRAAATPAGVQSLVLSRAVEEDASFAALGARQALDAVGPYRTMLACELVTALRCVRMRGLRPEPLQGLLAACDHLDAGTADRNLTGDIAAAEAVLAPSIR